MARLSFHWKPVVFAGLLSQVILFIPAVAERVGDLGPWLYVASTAAVLAALLRNARIPGLPVVALGAFSNLLAIVANGGYMPASPAAMAAGRKGAARGLLQQPLTTDPVLAPLTDIFALPTWLPFANVFSIGDVLIGVGVVWAIVAAMRSGRCAPADAADWRSDLRANRGIGEQPRVRRHVVRAGGPAFFGARVVVSITRDNSPSIDSPSRANPS